MLAPLFGNKNIVRILLFLFVNGKGYSTQLHRLLKVPLTPIQKAMERLEKGEIVISYYEGKTRVYILNAGYPLIQELEQLLKKAYTLLTAKEKKEFYVPTAFPQTAQNDNKHQILLSFWKQLQNVTQLHFHAKTKSQDEHGWNGKGHGEVNVSKQDHNILLFSEKGHWSGPSGKISFSNVYRWTLDREACVISLEHLRRGPDHPVFLFHLAPTGKNSLSSVDSHLCEGDTYFGQIHFDSYQLRLNWRVIGPKKNEEIDYHYT